MDEEQDGIVLETVDLEQEGIVLPGVEEKVEEETDTASVILNGFSNVGYDGKALFATDHPLINSTKVVSNLISGVLNDENLKAALTLMRAQTD